MAIIPLIGRAAIAQAVKNQDIHMAWGLGNPQWATNENLDRAFDGNGMIALNGEGAYGTEQLVNGTFATDFSGWTAEEGAALAVSNNRLQITNGGGRAVQRQSIEAQRRHRLRGSFVVLSVGQTVSAKVQVVDAITGAELAMVETNQTTVQPFSLYFDGPLNGYVDVRLICDGDSAGLQVAFIGLSLVYAGGVPIEGLIVRSTDRSVTYLDPSDYSVDADTGVITRNASGSIGALQNVNLDFTLQTPVAHIYQTRLVSELGRLQVTTSEFVRRDDAGDIVLPQGRFSVTTEQTRFLYTEFVFGFNDADTATIRETGIFLGTELVGGLPAGQTYFGPSEVTDRGLLLSLENVAPIVRSAASRETFRSVITL